MKIFINHYMVVEDKTLHTAIWQLLEGERNYLYCDFFDKDEHSREYGIDNDTTFKIQRENFDKVASLLPDIETAIKQAKKEKCGWIRVDAY